jgi:hypothetical protein
MDSSLAQILRIQTTNAQNDMGFVPVEGGFTSRVSYNPDLRWTMSAKNYSLLCGIIFFVLLILHVLRIVMHVHIAVNGMPIVMQASWLGIIVAGLLAFLGLRAWKNG